MELGTRISIGVDPGKSGALAFIKENGDLLSMHEMPLIGKEYDEHAIKKLLTMHQNQHKVHIIIEDVQPSRDFGLQSSASLLECKGLLRGICVGLNLPYTLVAPRTWQKEMWQGIRKVEKKTNRIKKNGDHVYKTDPKPTSEVAAKRLFPGVDLRGNVEVKYYSDTAQNRKLGRAGKEIVSRKVNAHDGIIDALLIADWGRRKLK